MHTACPKYQPWLEVKPEGRMLRLEQVVERINLSRSQIYALISEGNFPPLIKLSRRASALPESWLDAFIADRARSVIGDKREQEVEQ